MDSSCPFGIAVAELTNGQAGRSGERGYWFEPVWQEGMERSKILVLNHRKSDAWMARGFIQACGSP